MDQQWYEHTICNFGLTGTQDCPIVHGLGFPAASKFVLSLRRNCPTREETRIVAKWHSGFNLDKAPKPNIYQFIGEMIVVQKGNDLLMEALNHGENCATIHI